MFTPSRDQVRRFLADAWRKRRDGLPATPPRNVFVDDELDKPVTIYRITVGDSP